VSGPVVSVCRRWSRSSVLSASFSSPRRPRSRGQLHSTPGSLLLACVVVSASPPLFRRAHARVSLCLRPSNSAQRSASLSTSPSSSWLRLPSLGEPALPAPTRAYLAGVPPWPPASWPGLCSPPFLLILVPKASLGLAVARPRSLLPCLRPETPAVGRAPPPCRHSRGRGT